MTVRASAGQPTPPSPRERSDADAPERLPTVWAGGAFAWGTRTFVMAIVNATPDSFSGDGMLGDPAAATAAALHAVVDGANLIDIGAESTRPGHTAVAAADELARLLPILRAIRASVDVPISVDTSKAEVAAAALAAGASLVNDVRGLTGDPDLAAVVAAHAVPAVITHDLPPDVREDLTLSIVRELSRRLDCAVSAGIAWEHLIVDPGFGFGKDWKQNLELLRRLGDLRVLGRPILVGTSRKGTIGRVLGVPEHDRVEGTAATIALAVANGADMVRVHDVRAQSRVARMADAVVRGAPAVARTWPGDPPG